MPEPASTPSIAAANTAEQQLDGLTRRSLATGGFAAAALAAGGWWLRSARDDDGIPWPLRRVLQLNARLAQAGYSPSRLAPTFDRALAKEPRANGRLGLHGEIDTDRWRVDVLSPGERPAIERSLPLAAIYELPRFEMVTEFKCVEGWSQIVHWTGARLGDFLARHGHESPYVALMTPDRGYYVGLDRASAIHSQSLLAYAMNGRPLSPGHGAPLRLVCPLKYGVKSIKRIGVIQCTHQRPADYWAERGYDWYLGL